MEQSTLLLCLVGSAVLIAVALLVTAIRVIPEYQRLVVFRLGRSIGARGPGVVILIPIVDRGVKVDLREQVRDIPHHTIINKGNESICVVLTN